MVVRINCPHLQSRKVGSGRLRSHSQRVVWLGSEPRCVQLPDSGPKQWAACLAPGEAQGPGDSTATVSLVPLLRYQFNPAFFQTTVTAQILLKALTNLPHTDFTLCKCMIDQAHVSFPFPGLGVWEGAGQGS